MSEDCLFLNIWTPAGASSGSYYPVMVWIYGGGFQQGASSHAEYGGANLAQRGVVVVSLNYRLGALGFMVSVDDAMWGNFGLQVRRAFRWQACLS
jgi:para-nitrobenzyl esterase